MCILGKPFRNATVLISHVSSTKTIWYLEAGRFKAIPAELLLKFLMSTSFQAIVKYFSLIAGVVDTVVTIQFKLFFTRR